MVEDKERPITSRVISVSCHATAVGGVVVAGDGGGFMAPSSSFRFLPLGAGSRGGDLLYVTVLVTTDRTLTGLGHALRGGSKRDLVALSMVQSAGEKGENNIEPDGRLLIVRGEGPLVAEDV